LRGISCPDDGHFFSGQLETLPFQQTVGKCNNSERLCHLQLFLEKEES
jgi:hypothetical protein